MVFKNIFPKKMRIEEEMINLNEKIIKQGMFRKDNDKEKLLKEELKEILAREDIYWNDTSKEISLKEGILTLNFSIHQLKFVESLTASKKSREKMESQLMEWNKLERQWWNTSKKFWEVVALVENKI